MLPGFVVLLAYAAHFARYDFLSDDCFIGFRYARNLADGLGLVWNPAERVEGYTNFLWVLTLSIGIRIGIPPEELSRGLGFLAGALVLVTTASLSARCTGWRDPFVWAAPALLAANRSFAAWSSGGLETQAFSFLVLAGYALLLRDPPSPHAPRAASALVLALATLTRPEGALFAACAAALLLSEVLARRASPRRFLAWGALYALPVTAHLLWRHAYYGFWLPNTFYAKVPGLHFSRGLEYLRLFHEDFAALWLLPPVVALVLWRRQRSDLLFGGALAAFLAYVAAIGGDRFDFRMLVPVLPLFYWLVAEAIAAAAQLLPARRRVVSLALLGGVLLVTALGSNRPEARVGRGPIESLEETRRYGRGRIEQGLYLRALVDKGVLPTDLRIGVSGAGAVPYYTRWYTVDRLGLNDVKIARQPVLQRGVPGHEREATPEDLAARRVALNDVFSRIVFEDDPQLPARIARTGVGGARSLRVDDHCLVFTTTLSEREYTRLFAGLSSCF